eukprot:gene34908-46896_t
MIPDFQTIMLPFLQFLNDGKEHEINEIKELIYETFKLTDKEINEVLPSGRQKVINNRIGWARTYLKKAGLIEYSKRATFKITPDGLSILKTKPTRIDVKFLEKLPAFQQWKVSYQSLLPEENNKQVATETDVNKTPEELLEYSFTKLREELIVELLDRIKSSSYSFFEILVVDLLINMGYGGSRKEAGE